MRSEFPVRSNGRNIENYLHTRRRRAGLSQGELGKLLGYADEGPVARHEQSKNLPPLRVAIAYQIIFQADIADLFPQLSERTMRSVEQSLIKFEKEIQAKMAKGSRAPRLLQKVAWLAGRRNTDHP